MKRVLYIASLLLIAGSAFAETMVTRTCEALRKTMGYPYYYCYCKEESETFLFPQDRVVSDTMWFDASVDDLKNGISAFWFAECAVTMDVYAFCSSKEPTISLTVGPNRMSSKSAEDINKKLEEMGGLADLMGSVLTPHIRVYPHQKGSGHVYCYPFGQGPHSTCDSLLPVRSTMKYISSHADDVYALEPQTMPTSGLMYVHWMAEDNQPCTLEVASDCQGGTLFTTTLSDSLEVYWVDSTLLRRKKAAGETLYFRFTHEVDAGWIRFTSDPVCLSALRDSAVCEGKAAWSPQDTLLLTDTLWYATDTLLQQGYRLIILPPDTIADTLAVPHSLLETGYYYQPADTILRDTGTYVLTIETEGECTYILHLTVQETATTALTDSLPDNGRRTLLCIDPRHGIYILRDGRRYTILGNLINY
ncbi:MAG: hypothetical protein ACI4BD_06935 [Paludibacteraceae bacterium]